MKKASTYNGLLQNLYEWAESSHDVKATILVGSRARTSHPADEYSDLDMILIVTNPGAFLKSNSWLENIGYYWLLFDERTIDGGLERRVLFDNALDVDFVICSEDDIRRAITNNNLDLLKRGYRVTVDKIGLSEIIPDTDSLAQIIPPPAESECLNLINDFWYHSVWSAKKLLRGEIWMAKSCVDVYMKHLLLRIIEIHAHAKNGWDYDTWFNGRFFDKWAEQRVKDGIRYAFAHYEEKDIIQALSATMDLFRVLAIETCDMLGFNYPYEANKKTTDWVKKALDSQITSSSPDNEQERRNIDAF